MIVLGDCETRKKMVEMIGCTTLLLFAEREKTVVEEVLQCHPISAYVLECVGHGTRSDP